MKPARPSLYDPETLALARSEGTTDLAAYTARRIDHFHWERINITRFRPKFLDRFK